MRNSFPLMKHREADGQKGNLGNLTNEEVDETVDGSNSSMAQSWMWLLILSTNCARGHIGCPFWVPGWSWINEAKLALKTGHTIYKSQWTSGGMDQGIEITRSVMHIRIRRFMWPLLLVRTCYRLCAYDVSPPHWKESFSFVAGSVVPIRIFLNKPIVRRNYSDKRYDNFIPGWETANQRWTSNLIWTKV